MIDPANLDKLDNSATSNGFLNKWYDRRNLCYVKTSSVLPNGNYHIESYMECIASSFGKLVGFEIVNYSMDEIRLNNLTIAVSVCPDYSTRIGNIQDIVTAEVLLSKNLSIKVSQRYKTLVEEYPHLRKDLDRMIAYDYLIDNYDRHMRNIEFYRTVDGNILMSPLFDNGSSLLSDWVTEEDLKDLMQDEDLYEENIVHASTPSKCFSLEHASEILLIDTKSLEGLNLNVTVDEIAQLVEPYKDVLGSFRIEAIVNLLVVRLSNLRRIVGYKGVTMELNNFEKGRNSHSRFTSSS